MVTVRAIGARMSIVTAAAHHLRERSATDSAAKFAQWRVCALHLRARCLTGLTRDTDDSGLLRGRRYGARRYTLRHSHSISLRGAWLGAAQRRARWRRTGSETSLSCRTCQDIRLITRFAQKQHGVNHMA